MFVQVWAYMYICLNAEITILTYVQCLHGFILYAFQ